MLLLLIFTNKTSINFDLPVETYLHLLNLPVKAQNKALVFLYMKEEMSVFLAKKEKLSYYLGTICNSYYIFTFYSMT